MPPMAFEGKRHEQIMNGEREGLGQRTGLMAVRDLGTGARAVVKIYDEQRDPRREADAGDIFFTRFHLCRQRREIEIENERGQTFVFHIEDGTVQPRN